MKTLISLAFIALSAAPLGAAVILPSTNLAVSAWVSDTQRNFQILPTITSANLGGATQLIIEFQVTRTNTTTGDSWLGMFTNLPNPSPTATTPGAVITTQGIYSALVRTRAEADIANNTHQTFRAGSGVSSSAVPITSAGFAVRISINLPNSSFTGNSTAVFAIDENPSGAFSADKTLTNTINWGATDIGATFGFASSVKDHQMTNLTITAVPEPASAALLSLGALALLRRKRN